MISADLAPRGSTTSDVSQDLRRIPKLEMLTRFVRRHSFGLGGVLLRPITTSLASPALYTSTPARTRSRRKAYSLVPTDARKTSLLTLESFPTISYQKTTHVVVLGEESQTPTLSFYRPSEPQPTCSAPSLTSVIISNYPTRAPATVS